MQNDTLPETFRPLLWSYDFARIDQSSSRLSTTARSHIGAGSYKVTAVKESGDVLTHVPASEIKPRSLRLASLVFGVERFNYAPRGTH
jgi:hypothetical protein